MAPATGRTFHITQFYLAGGRAIVSDQPLYCLHPTLRRSFAAWSHRDALTLRFRNRLSDQPATDRRQPRSVLTVSQVARLEGRNNQLRALELYYQAKECFFGGDYMGADPLVIDTSSRRSCALCCLEAAANACWAIRIHGESRKVAWHRRANTTHRRRSASSPPSRRTNLHEADRQGYRQ